MRSSELRAKLEALEKEHGDFVIQMDYEEDQGDIQDVIVKDGTFIFDSMSPEEKAEISRRLYDHKQRIIAEQRELEKRYPGLLP